MKIDKKQNGNEIVIKLEGRLDTNTSPELEKEIQDLNLIEKIIFDFKNLVYMSSAGLRILLSCRKNLNSQGSVVIKNVRPEIKEVFDITGFSEILTIE